jgi:hypothetical protein
MSLIRWAGRVIIDAVSDRVLRELVEHLASLVVCATAADLLAAEERLAGLRGDQWLRFDDLSRRFTLSTPSPLAQVTTWPVSLQSPAPVIAIAASVSRDGHVREDALGWLANLRGPAVAAAVAVRTDDWVQPVTLTARRLVRRFDAPGEVAAIVAIMLRLVHRRRGRPTANAYLSEIASGPREQLLALAGRGERAVRLWALAAAQNRGLVSAPSLLDRALADPDPVLALWCAHRLLAADPPAAGSWSALMLTSRRATVRALDRDQLAARLLDSSGAVRAVARWRWTRRWGSPTDQYRQALACADRPSVLAAALDGLRECAAEDTAGDAMAWVTHPSPRVRTAAARILGSHAAYHHGPLDPLLDLLSDPAPRVTRTATRYLRERAGEIPTDVLTRLATDADPRSRRTALSLRQRLDTWERIRSDLQVVDDADADLAQAARADLLAWLSNDASRTYSHPTPEQQADIARLLGTEVLTDRQRRHIAFVAGISRR